MKNLIEPWRTLLRVGFALLIIALLLAAIGIACYKRHAWAAFRVHSQAQIDTLASFTAEWIVRGQPESIRSAAKLLLLGTGLYVDVILPDGEIISEVAENLPTHLTPTAMSAENIGMAAGILEKRYELREITVLISQEEIPGSVIGLIRVGFSGLYVADRVQARRLLLLGGSLGGWLAIMVGYVLVVVKRQQRQVADESNSSTLVCGTLEIDLESTDVTLNGVSLDLTRRQYDLLSIFAQNPGTIFSDDDLLREHWADSAYATSADVKQGIYVLRQKLRPAHSDPKQLIANIKGFGYRLNVNAAEESVRCE